MKENLLPFGVNKNGRIYNKDSYDWGKLIIQKDSGEWIKRESTFVMDQKYFMENTKTGKHYYKIALDELRNKKINEIKDKC